MMVAARSELSRLRTTGLSAEGAESQVQVVLLQVPVILLLLVCLCPTQQHKNDTKTQKQTKHKNNTKRGRVTGASGALASVSDSAAVGVFVCPPIWIWRNDLAKAWNDRIRVCSVAVKSRSINQLSTVSQVFFSEPIPFQT